MSIKVKQVLKKLSHNKIVSISTIIDIFDQSKIETKMLKVLYRIYQWFIFVPLLILSTIWCTLTIIIGSTLGNNKFWGYYPGVLWGRFVCNVALSKVYIKNNELIDDQQSYIFVANHQSAFDIFLVYGYIGHNFKWLMKGAIRKMPLVGTASAKAGHVFVDNSSRQGIVNTMRQMKNTLKDGISTVVFPEGHRTPDGKVAEFKKGAFQTALSLKLPIVPITIDGAYNILPINSIMMNHSNISLTFHDPIPTEGLTNDDLPMLMEKVRDTIKSSLKE